MRVVKERKEESCQRKKEKGKKKKKERAQLLNEAKRKNVSFLINTLERKQRGSNRKEKVGVKTKANR